MYEWFTVNYSQHYCRKIKWYVLQLIQTQSLWGTAVVLSSSEAHLRDRRFYLDLHPGAQCTLAWASYRKCSHNMCLFQGRESSAGHRGKTHRFDEVRMAKSSWKHSFLPRLCNIYRNQFFWSFVTAGAAQNVASLWFITGEKNMENLLLNNQNMQC